MFGTVSARVGGATAAAVALLGLVLSCSSPTPPTPPTAGPIADVQVESLDGGTVISLVGAGGSPYQTDFASSPPRILLSLPGTEVGAAPTSSAVYDEFVQEVVLSSDFGEDEDVTTTVEVSLSSDTSFDVVPAGGDLEIHVGSPGDADADMLSMNDYDAPMGEIVEDDAFGDDEGWVEMDEAAAADPYADSMTDGSLAETDFEGGDDWIAPAPVELTPATVLTGVDPEGGPEGTVVRIMADGMPSGVESFALEDPARLVVDLPGIKSEVKDQRMLVGSAHVDAIRVGQHADKVRVVMDAGSVDDPFGQRQISPVPDGLVIALGAGENVDRALETARAELSAPAPMAQNDVFDLAEEGGDALQDDSMGMEMEFAADTGMEPVTAADLGAITSVEFLPSADADRIVVQSDRPVDYTVFKPDDETFVLLFSGVGLSPEASTQLLPEPGGPVSLVSAFAQPELETPEVRLVVKRASGLEPSLGQFGNEIVVGFERGQGDASTLPVLTGEAASGAAGKAMAQADAAMMDDVLDGGNFAPVEPVLGEIAPAEQHFDAPAAIDADVAVDYLQEGGLLDGKEYAGRRISLDFKEVDIRDVLRLIADVSDLNVIAGDEVQGNVTIRLVDVPWDQALDVILLTKGLGFVRVGNVLRIAPGDILKQEEEARLQERRAKEKLEDLVVKLQPVNYADVKEVSTLVKRLLTPRGSVDTDERTNTIIIKDIAAVIDEATALVKAIDTQTPQVMIEARIVEANLDFSREIGTEFGGGTQIDDDETDFNVGGLLPFTTPGNGWPRNDSNNVVFSNPITNTPTGIMNIGSFLLDSKYNVDFRLTAAELNGEGKVISSPRVVTLDNREALIEQGVSIPFQTFENGDAQLEFIDAVLQLKVTPHITADRSIIMSIEVARNAPDASVETPTGSPAIAKNQAKTETLVKDGQTLVIGGIYVIDKAETSSRVPYLWEMPVLGHMFKNTGLRDQRKELLIFVTPSVVTGRAIDASAG